MNPNRSHPNRQALGWLWQIARPYRGTLLAGVLLATLVILSNVALLALSGWFITAMALAGLGATVINYFTPAAAIRGLAITRTLGRYLERLITHEATFRLIAGLRQWFFNALEPLAPARLQDYHGGDLLSRIRADIDTLENAYLRMATPLMAALIATVLMTGFLLFWNPWLALLNLVGLLTVGLLFPIVTLRRGQASGEALVQARSRLRERSQQTIRGLAELSIYGDPAQALQQAAADTEAILSPQRQQNRLDATSAALVGLISQFTWLGLFLLAAHIAGTDGLSGPEIVMLVFFGMASFEAVAALPQALRAWGETRAAALRLLELTGLPPTVIEPTNPQPLPARHDLCFDAVSFTYPGAASATLKQVSFCLAPGEKLGLRGASGSGKTTLAQLLLKFWQPTAGQICYGDVDLAALHGDALRSQISVVSQQIHLFNTSIAANLRLAKPDATLEELTAACASAEILPEILALPQGFDTLVGEAGAALSGGQIRRLGIARALLKAAPLVILDEPTEGLDAHTEARVTEALRRLLHGRSALIISHRPAVLALADRVMRLHDGQLTALA
ncbi:thiol reductant ABC exporter subunit CydC [Halothiobacillus sp. DCM-1]|uniref:thiol reductant ABC exporter subunit CydC n=1 Tax=Halothiobacillus sp. DCM-1 TaxID=3112558 RepID=UPI003252A0A7